MHRVASHLRDNVAGSLCLVSNKRDLPSKNCEAEGKGRLNDPPCTIYGFCLPLKIRRDSNNVLEECAHTGSMPLEAIERSAQPSRHHKITDKASATTHPFPIADADGGQGHYTFRKIISNGTADPKRNPRRSRKVVFCGNPQPRTFAFGQFECVVRD